MPFKSIRILPYSMLFAAILLAVNACGAAADRSTIIFSNSLPDEIVTLRVRYATPYDEPRHSSSRVCLPSGADYRIGVQGTKYPEHIRVDLATKTYDFADLSPLAPDGDMRLQIAHEEGRPLLRRLDSGSEDDVAIGVEHDFLSAANRPNAVDRDFLTDAETMEEVMELVKETASDAQENLGDIRTLDIEAGPIWNHDHALERCPEAIAEWNEANDGKARWTGHWSTTVPGEMSVCNCIEGAAVVNDTLVHEDDGWGRSLYFPVFWIDWTGVAQVGRMSQDEPDSGIGVRLRFNLAGVEDIEEMLDELLGDLRVDGFRPWAFRMRTWNEEKQESDDVEMLFSEGEGDKYDDQDAMQERLFAAYADATLAEATAIWVKTEAFDAAKAGEEPPSGQGVAVMFSKGTFEAAFIPDGTNLMQ